MRIAVFMNYFCLLGTPPSLQRVTRGRKTTWIESKIIVFNDQSKILDKYSSFHSLVVCKNFNGIQPGSLLELIGPHKYLFLVSNDIEIKSLKLIHFHFNSKIIFYLMTHNFLGSGSSYPELENDLDSELALRNAKEIKDIDL